jgi:hypothetical protein
VKVKLKTGAQVSERRINLSFERSNNALPNRRLSASTIEISPHFTSCIPHYTTAAHDGLKTADQGLTVKMQ